MTTACHLVVIPHLLARHSLGDGGMQDPLL